MEVINELLGYERIKIVQETEMFNFSLDSMLLANFATITRKTKHIVDFCSGNFPIPLFMTLRTEAKISGLEIQEKAVNLALKSLELNNLSERIEVINGDVKEVLKYFNPSSVDLVTCNPPYFKLDENSNTNKNLELTIARHELLLNLEDVIRSASKILKDGGYLAMVHRPERLSDILEMLKKYHFSPSRLQFVYPKEGRECNHLLIEARLGAYKNSNLKILSPLFVYNPNNKWTKEVLNIYNYGIDENK